MSREDDRLNVRAMQILDDPTLRANQLVPNAKQLLRALAQDVKGDPHKLQMVLDEITDPRVKAEMAAALNAENGA